MGKNPQKYLPLHILRANSPTNPTLPMSTQLILILAASMPGDQISNDSDSTDLPTLHFHHSRQRPSLERLYFTRHYSSCIGHILFLIQSTGSLCAQIITHSMTSAANPLPSKCSRTQAITSSTKHITDFRGAQFIVNKSGLNESSQDLDSSLLLGPPYLRA